VITYAIKKKADVHGRILEMTFRGTSFILEGEKKKEDKSISPGSS
ncbi:unnamed protein product, partial [marine sediment metagenome]